MRCSAHTMGTLTPGRPVLCVFMRNNELRPVPSRSPCFMHPTFRPFRLQPLVAVPGPWSGFDPELTARSADRIPRGTMASIGLRLPLEVGHDNQPNRVRYPADQSFTLSCSPPPLTRTQLLSVTEFKPTPTRTFTLLIRYTYKRTTAGPSARTTSRTSPRNKIVPQVLPSKGADSMTF